MQRSLASEQIRHDSGQHASTHSATPPSETGTPAAEIASGAVVDVASSHLPVTFSNSSNSSACCMPSLGAQVGPSYDISASARGAEQRLHNGSAPQANATQYSRLGQDDYMRANLQPQAALPSFAVQSSLASVFDDVDSGRHQQAGLDSAQLGHGQISHHRRRVNQQDSLPSAYRSFFPEDPPVLQSQQQLNRQQLLQLLPPQLQERHDPQVAHHQHMHQLPGHQPQQMSFSNLTNLHQPINGMSFNQLSPDMQQWPSPVSQRASSSRAMQPGDAAASRQPIKLEDLDLSDLSGLKRDFSSFTSPTSQPRQPRPPPRRALSFTQGSLASAASTAAVGTAAARRTQGGPNSSQAASHSRLSTPASNVTSPPDTDASLSDSDEMSGSDSGGIKRRRVLKGKRGGSYIFQVAAASKHACMQSCLLVS